MLEGSIHKSGKRELLSLLGQFPAVVIVGPRQVGKTTLARSLAESIDKPTIYLDLELPGDLAQLQQAELFFKQYQDHLIILDEVQREKSLFPALRAIIDQYRVPGRFILLGSALPELIRDASESLAGRVAYHQLHPFSIEELDPAAQNKLWSRGGIPDSFLAPDDALSFRWRQNFIRSYLERDLPLLGLSANPVTIRRLWEMLAHQNGQLLNTSALSRSLGLSVPTIKRYIDFMEAAFLISVIKPWHTNLNKRLVKSPKVYVLDTGILHALLGIQTYDALLGHPIAGASYENFVLNQIKCRFDASQIYFYRTADGTEMDFVITENGKPEICVEVKLSSAPTTTKSFTTAKQDLGTHKNFIISPVIRSYPIATDVQVMNISDWMKIGHTAK